MATGDNAARRGTGLREPGLTRTKHPGRGERPAASPVPVAS
ncbi:hypothetical protein [Streptomyces sp. NPDC002540]